MTMTLTGSPPITAAALDAAINTELATNWFPLAGVTTNSNAAAGQIGEYISSSIAVGSAVALSTGVAANVTSISLTAGDWDLAGCVATAPAGSTTTQVLVGAFSTASATLPTIPAGGGISQLYVGSTGGAISVLPITQTRFSLASTTTIFLVADAGFSVSTMSAYGFIGARRVR